MGRIYQQSVKEKTKKIIEVLVESKFFEENNIRDTSFAETIISDMLTEKFIVGELDCDERIFQEDEFESLLKKIIVCSVMNELVVKGFVNTVENEMSEEVFFLTKKGRTFLKKNRV